MAMQGEWVFPVITLVSTGSFLPAAPNVGALITRMGFGGLLTIFIVEYTPKPYSNRIIDKLRA